MWLAAFTDAIESPLAEIVDMSFQSDLEAIEDLLMEHNDIHFSHNVNKNNITHVGSAAN